MKNRNIVKMAVYLLLLRRIFYGRAKRKNITYFLFYFLSNGAIKNRVLNNIISRHIRQTSLLRI